MPLADDVQVLMLLADYVGIDGGGKLNAIGAGITLIPMDPQRPGLTAPMYLYVGIQVPTRHEDQEFALVIELRDPSRNEAVRIIGQHNQPEALRVSQLVRVPRSNPGLPREVPVGVQSINHFQDGLPLQQGNRYEWRLSIDSQHRPYWTASFFVPGPPPGPVIGGPIGPADIPGIQPS